MVLCQICGNEIESGGSVCPYCGGVQDITPKTGSVGGVFHRVVNLELGRPFVEGAMQKLRMEIENSRQQNLRVLTVIHGYGSSGKGGAIGIECRKVLEHLQARGEIHSFIFGEDFRQKSGPTRDLLRHFPQLGTNINLNKGNRGVTLVVL